MKCKQHKPNASGMACEGCGQILPRKKLTVEEAVERDVHEHGKEKPASPYIGVDTATGPDEAVMRFQDENGAVLGEVRYADLTEVDELVRRLEQCRVKVPRKKPADVALLAGEGEIPCNKFASWMIPLVYARLCALKAGHDGECKPGGRCFAHGRYIGEKCPKWPSCEKDLLDLKGMLKREFRGGDLPWWMAPKYPPLPRSFPPKDAVGEDWHRLPPYAKLVREPLPWASNPSTASNASPKDTLPLPFWAKKCDLAYLTTMDAMMRVRLKPRPETPEQLAKVRWRELQSLESQ